MAFIKCLFQKIDFIFNIGYPILVSIRTELGSDVFMTKTKQNKTKIDDIEINQA